MPRNNKLSAIIIIVMIITIFNCTFLVGCTQNDSPELMVDKMLFEMSEQNENTFKYYPDYKTEIIRYNERLEVIYGGNPNDKSVMLINSNFYEHTSFAAIEYNSETNVPQEFYTTLKNAEKKVEQYIDSSTVIKAEDKENAKNYVQNVTAKNVSPSESENEILMCTIGNTIYINNNMITYIDERSIIHELIHVVSNYTNANQKNEFSSYRGSILNEAITELIAKELCDEYNIPESDSEVVYEEYFTETLLLLKKFNLLEAYFYSDKYEDVKSKYSSELFDLIVLVMNNFNDSEQDHDNLARMLSAALNEVYGRNSD